MRIGVFHNRYLQRGGEDSVVDFSVELLAKAGHEVHLFAIDNREEIAAVRGGALRAALYARWNPTIAARVAEFVAQHPIDVAHVHNTFPLLSPSLHPALRERGIPVVQTLHNYRLLCANGLFFRAGRPCEACVERGPWNAVRHGCYRGSRAQTLVWSEMTAHHRRRGTWPASADLFTAPSEFARARLWPADLPATRVRVVPNPVADPGKPGGAREGAVFVGRLSPEKGVGLLLEAWRALDGFPLTIAGTGPEEPRLRALADEIPGVRMLGEVSRERVAELLGGAAFAVAPSLWYETFGMAVAEAMAAGTAVVAPSDTAMAELVETGRNGLLFQRGDGSSLTDACRTLAADPDTCRSMGEEGRLLYEDTLAPDTAVTRLEKIYEEALSLHSEGA